MPLPPQDRAALQALERKRRQRQKEQRIAWCILFGIVLVIFGLGMLFGWHLGTVHAVDEVPTLTETQAPATTILESVNEVSHTHTFYETPPVVTTEPIVIECEGNVLDPELQSIMEDLCEEYGVPFALAVAVAEQETRFNPDATSSTNDFGLMQINRINFEWLRERGIDPLTDAGNIEAGVLILSKALKRYGEIELALMAYNCGDTGAKRLWDAGTYSTQYSRQVMERYNKWVQILEGE